MNLSHTLKSFQELSTDELYAILKLRSEVFVVEQNCPYQDMDYKDQKCFHECSVTAIGMEKRFANGFSVQTKQEKIVLFEKVTTCYVKNGTYTGC